MRRRKLFLMKPSLLNYLQLKRCHIKSIESSAFKSVWLIPTLSFKYSRLEYIRITFYRPVNFLSWRNGYRLCCHVLGNRHASQLNIRMKYVCPIQSARSKICEAWHFNYWFDISSKNLRDQVNFVGV